MEDNKAFKPEAIVEVIDNGPLKITGNFEIKDIKRDKVYKITEVWLCRCGRSDNKPFCDDSHKK